MAPLTRAKDLRLPPQAPPAPPPVQPEPEAATASAAALLAQAKALYRDGKAPEALRLANQAAALAPGDVDICNARGVFLRALGRSAESLACYQRAIELAPESAGAWSNLGNSLKDLRHFASAVTCHERAVRLRPNDPTFLHNLGIALAAANRHADALAPFNRALLFKPGDPNIRWDRGLSHLQLGDLTAGWVDYEARFENGLLSRRPLPGAKWLGQRFPGQRLVITAEQGFGDAIWAARCLRRVKDLGGEIALECREDLIPLFAELDLVDQFIVKGCELPPAEWHCSICSLPGLFFPTLAEVDGSPYLTIRPGRTEAMDRLLAEAGEGLRVGIVWSGSVTFKGNAERSAELERFRQAFSLPGIRLFSLQKGPQAEDLGKGRAGGITDLGPVLHDFWATAAAIQAMDLIIMTDTAVAHLAGALGKPVWLLLGHACYWLWRLEGQSCPWYQSIRMFRQRAPGDWASVFDEAANALLQWRPQKAQIEGPSKETPDVEKAGAPPESRPQKIQAVTCGL